MRGFRLLCLLLLVVGESATAHPLAPALLELKTAQGTNFEVHWRLSALQRSRAVPAPVFPAHCRNLDEPQYVNDSARAVSARWTIDCGERGLKGSRIAVSSLAGSGINVILRIEDAEGRTVEALLDSSQPDYEVAGPAQAGQVLLRYLRLGVEHLIGGADHLLFVLALVALIQGWRKLALTITAFTLGHSVTLALATLGLVRVHAPLMELGIAVSLVLMARELLREQPSWIRRRPALVALAFGLLHGLGFAGALTEVGLPADAIPLALLGFNLGIEVAQLGLLAVFLPLLAGLRRLSTRPRVALGLRLGAAYAVGSLAMLWCLQRTGALWSA